MGLGQAYAKRGLGEEACSELVAAIELYRSMDMGFRYPHGLAVDGAGRVYVADSGNQRIQVFTPDGEYIREWGGYGEKQGRFVWPRGVAIDASGRVYVADSGNARIQKFTASGQFVAKWGQ